MQSSKSLYEHINIINNVYYDIYFVSIYIFTKIFRAKIKRFIDF